MIYVKEEIKGLKKDQAQKMICDALQELREGLLNGSIVINSLSSTTHNYRKIDKNKQKWYNRSARKKAEKSKKACT